MNLAVLGSTVVIDETAVAESADEIRRQVREYAAGDRPGRRTAGRRRSFDLAVDRPEGLLGEVMAAMAEIPYVETRTYGDLAADLGTASVAVGRACGRNPVPVVVPCHRVVGSDGGLKGYSAADCVATKRRLFEHEAAVAGGSVQSRLSGTVWAPGHAKR
jgi:methylated-DNA-[protein]-cysteine S-methyltransferase